MIDRENVIKALQTCSVQNDAGCQGCPYFEERKTYGHEWCTTMMAQEALALLKEQEAKPMTEYDDGWDCPRCGLKLVGKTASGYPCDEFDLPNDEIVKYCPVCGQAVKWG